VSSIFPETLIGPSRTIENGFYGPNDEENPLAIVHREPLYKWDSHLVDFSEKGKKNTELLS